MADAFIKTGYKVISGGTDNHSMLIDLHKIPQLPGKMLENVLVKTDITINKTWYLSIAAHHSKHRDGDFGSTTRASREKYGENCRDLSDRNFNIW